MAIKFFKKAISINPEILIQEFDWFQHLKRRNKKRVFDELESLQSEFKDYLIDQTKDVENKGSSYVPSPPEKMVSSRPSRDAGADSARVEQAGWQENSETIRFAGFWKRLIAFIVDGIILVLASAMLLIVLRYGFGVRNIFVRDLHVLLLWYTILTLSLWLYYAIMESSRCQGTLGKMLLGIYVADQYGRPIGIGRASGRYFLRVLLFSSIALGLVDCVMVAVTEKKQAWHDMPVGCFVLSK